MRVAGSRADRLALAGIAEDLDPAQVEGSSAGLADAEVGSRVLAIAKIGIREMEGLLFPDVQKRSRLEAGR